ncbi:hypothetical protein PIB30_038439 [Stylosanthes scabra]|uniref:Transmembrane protein n=1 Tax=Stylosanthes scabra TaxID=79078 RepID=A0ABU6WC52_9FABA|nr:hypothetical protein [Stylosanthes scabra]
MSNKLLVLYFLVAITAQVLVLEEAMAQQTSLKLKDERKAEGSLIDGSRESSSVGEVESMAEAEAPVDNIRRLGKHHSTTDKSVAGGGVILGGLVTATFAAVFCYIRVTRKRDTDPASH